MSPARPPVRTMLVEDQAVVRDVLTRMAHDDPGIELVAVASDGLDALARARDLELDAIVCDVGMPRMDGLELLPTLRQMFPDAAIVMFSSDPLPETRDANLRLGADAFLYKGTSDDPFAMVCSLLHTRPEP